MDGNLGVLQNVRTSESFYMSLCSRNKKKFRTVLCFCEVSQKCQSVLIYLLINSDNISILSVSEHGYIGLKPSLLPAYGLSQCLTLFFPGMLAMNFTGKVAIAQISFPFDLVIVLSEYPVLPAVYHTAMSISDISLIQVSITPSRCISFSELF